MRYVPTYLFPTREEAEEAGFTPEFMYLEIASREHVRGDTYRNRALALLCRAGALRTDMRNDAAVDRLYRERGAELIAEARAKLAVSEARWAAATSREQTAEADAAKLRAALQKFPHDPLESTWTQAHADWYRNVCQPLLACRD